MRKLILDLGDLQVDPFEVEDVTFDGTGQATVTACVGSYSAPYLYCLRQPATKVLDGPCG